MNRVLSAIFTLLTVASVATAQPTVSASVKPDRMYVGSSVMYEVEVSGSQDADDVAPVFPEGLRGRYLNRRVFPAPTIIINGRPVKSLEDRVMFFWEVTADRTGAFVIPPAEVRIGSEMLTTQPVLLNVLEPAEPDDFAFVIEASKTRVFVGEPFTLLGRFIFGRTPTTVTFRGWLPEDAFDMYPATPALSTAGRPAMVPFLGGDAEGTLTEAALGGVQLPAVDMSRILVAKQPGRVQLGPWAMSCRVPIKGDSRTVEQCLVRSGTLELEVLPLPTRGRPANFNGMVGRCAVRATAMPTVVQVGDPITLELTIAASEPLSRIEPPDLARQAAFTDNFKIESTGWKETGAPVGGRTFALTIRATTSEIDRIPAIEFPYFDPESGLYATAMSREIPLEVEATRQVTLDDAVMAPAEAGGPIDFRPSLEDAQPGLLANATGPALLVNETTDPTGHVPPAILIALLAGPVALCAGVAILTWTRQPAFRAWRRRSGAAARAQRRIRQAGTDSAAISLAIRRYVGDRFDYTGEALTDADCRRLVTNAGSNQGDEIATVLRECERARFSTGATADSLAQRASEVVTGVERSIGKGQA